MTRLDRGSIATCRALARAVSGGLGVIGLAALAGWMVDAPLLGSIATSWAEMRPNTALALLLAGCALWPLTAQDGQESPRRRWWVRMAAGGVALIGALTLAQYLLGLNLGIDGLLVAGASGAGRMSPLAATDLLLLGVALFLTAGRPGAVLVVQYLSILAAFGAFVSIAGHVYGRETLHLVPFFGSSALLVAILLLALSVGVACAHPEDGLMTLVNAESAGGTMLRRLSPPIVLLPLVINWAELEGERRGLFPPGFGWMLGAAVTVLLGGLMVWIVSRVVHRKDVARAIVESELRGSQERDITERKRTEETLRGSLMRLQLLASATGDAIWDWDVVNDTTWWSDTFVEKFGYASGTIPTFAAWLEHVHPDDRARAAAEFTDAVARKAAAWSSEYRFRLADGSYGVIFDRAHGIHDAVGNLVRTVGSMIDITELRRVEAQARLLSHALESTSDLISITSLDDRFLFANRAFLDSYGYALEEVLGRTPDMLSPGPGAQPATHTTIRASVLERSWSGELVNCRKDGTEFPIYLNASPVRDAHGTVVALMGVAQDITARKRAEDTLRDSEARFRATFEQAAMGMSISALDGRFLRVNERLCSITGYDSEELLACTVGQITHPDDVARDIEHERRVTSGTIASYTMEKRFVRKNGSPVWVAATTSLVRQGTGAPDYFIDLVEDITPRRNLESQLLQTQKMEAIGQLAGGVAHDFNNMLAVIQGHVELIGLTTTVPAEARESLDEIGRAAQRATSLTRQLLLFGRREVMQPNQLDLNEIVTQLARMLQRLIGEDVRMRLHVHPRPLPIFADSGMIEQLLMNLAVNARDAMTGGGELIIETSETTIDEGTASVNDAEAGCYACLSVSDTGRGIPPEVLPHIFEPFFTTKEAGKGTGLGLATVFGIAKQHRGWVKVYSEHGLGTTFRFFLPSTALAAATPQPPAVVVLQRGRGETVLLAEDDESVREITRVMLERHGYNVVVANSGRDALRRWDETDRSIDLLLTDMVMPGGVGGTELAAQLQRRQPTLKVIFTSGYSAEIAGRALVLRDGQTFLQKPFDVSRLLTTIANLLHPSATAVD
jgi:PAS domain S-box-containing protein